VDCLKRRALVERVATDPLAELVAELFSDGKEELAIVRGGEALDEALVCGG